MSTLRETPEQERLRAVLRAGDPAADLPALDAELLRRRMAAAQGEAPRRRALPWVAVAAAAAALSVFVVLGGTLPRRQLLPDVERGTAHGIAATGATGGLPAAEADGPAVRQMQFQTPGGTRIIWMVGSSLTP